MVYDVADGLIHDLGASAAGASEEDALRDAHDSEWLREFERRTQAAKGRPTPAVAQSAG
jgi:hypothetical protein